MAYYGARNLLPRQLRYSTKTARMMGLGQTDEATAAAADAAATAAEAAVVAADAAATAAAVADPAALQAEIEKLKKENAALKKAMGKFWLGAAAGVAGSWAWGKWRNRSSF